VKGELFAVVSKWKCNSLARSRRQTDLSLRPWKLKSQAGGIEKPWLNPGGPSSKAKYSSATDSALVP